MPKPPEIMAGLRLDEPFFDAVIRRIGGCRLTERYTPPKDTRNVDYLIDGWIVELKTLMVDPLEAVTRQEKLRQFIQAEIPNPLYVTAEKREIRLSKEQERKNWVEIMGIPIQRALRDAEEQISDTRSFVPGPLPSALILVNSNVTSWGWSGFANLVNTYFESCPEIDAIIVMEALPEVVGSKEDYPLHFAAGARPEGPSAAPLLNQIAKSMAAEIELKSARPHSLIERDGFGPSVRMAFSFGPDGNLSLKQPSP